MVRADAEGKLGWSVGVDSTICRAHHDTNLERTTGCVVESQEPTHWAAWSCARSLARRALDEDPPARRRERPTSGTPLRPRPGRWLTDARPAAGGPLGG